MIYISEYAGYSPLRSDGTPIAEFKSVIVVDPISGATRKGIFITDNAKQIKELEAFPDFKHGFIKVDKMPTTTNTDGNIITGVHTGVREEFQKLSSELNSKFKRYYELKGKLINKNGSLAKDASEEELTELENLEKELNIEK